MIVDKYNIKLRYEGQTYIKMRPVNTEHLYLIVPLIMSNISIEEEDKIFIKKAEEVKYDIAYLYRITFYENEMYGIIIHDEQLELVN